MTIAFHDAMMKDPGNVHEYELSSPTPPTEEQLSDFIYSDAEEGSFIMLFEGPSREQFWGRSAEAAECS